MLGGTLSRSTVELKSHSNDMLAGSLFMGRTDQLDALFYAKRARPPLVIWDPNRIDLQGGDLVAFFDHVAGLPSARGLPLASAFDPTDAPGNQWLMLLEPTSFGTDFRYLQYGQGIAEYFGSSLNGKLTSALGGHISRFFIALYRAAMHRRQCVLSEHEPPAEVFVRIWRRLIVPLVDDAGFVTRFAVLNIPENQMRAGLEVVPYPCIVADRTRQVRFANTAARRFTGMEKPWTHRATLEDVFRNGIDLPEQPEALVDETSQPFRQSVTLDLPGCCGTVCEVHVGAARYRADTLFVISIMPPAR
ncbi:MAG: hypothetical protein AAF183_01715 [Pseudomonadota bacterium]